MKSLLSIVGFITLAQSQSDCPVVTIDGRTNSNTFVNGEWIQVSGNTINNKPYYTRISGSTTFYLFFMSALDGQVFNQWIIDDSLTNANETSLCTSTTTSNGGTSWSCSADSYYAQCDLNTDDLNSCSGNWEFPVGIVWVIDSGVTSICQTSSGGSPGTEETPAPVDDSTNCVNGGVEINGVTGSFSFVNGDWVPVEGETINGKPYYSKDANYLFFMTGCDGQAFNYWIIAPSIFNSNPDDICTQRRRSCNCNSVQGFYAYCEQNTDNLNDCTGNWQFYVSDVWTIDPDATSTHHASCVGR